MRSLAAPFRAPLLASAALLPFLVVRPALAGTPRRAPAVARAETPATAPADESEPAVQVPLDTIRALPDRAPFVPWLVLDTGRTPLLRRDPQSLLVQIHGEYQARAGVQRDLRLEPTAGAPDAKTLGQKKWLYHWFRVTPRFSFRDTIEIVGQIDIPRGFVLGDTTREVGAAREPMDEEKPFQVDPRWLYLEWMSPIGMFRVGRQGSHWGSGILANDGDHPTLFGDYRAGSVVDRLLFATRPAGRKSPFTVAIAGDVVRRDNVARWSEGDRAYQGVLALILGDETNQVGAYGVYRYQQRDREAVDDRTPFTEKLKVAVVDVAGRFATHVPGASAHVFGEAEAAATFGRTDMIRTRDQTRPGGTDERIRSMGGAVKLGAVHERRRGIERWGDVAFAVEWGWASGDADPNDGTSRRFTFDPNHRVGLILFSQVMHWKTARAATAATDPTLSARPPPGAQFLPSEGGVFGATYVNPTVVVRPHRRFDAKAGVVVAQTTADFIDPYRMNALGQVRNYDGGDPTRHDLGVEFDTGVEWRAGLDYGLGLQLGAQAGWLVPGRAFDDEKGNKMPVQWMYVGRVGLQY